MSDALDELLAITRYVYTRELDRVRKEWPLMPHPEFADKAYREAKQTHELACRIQMEQHDRLRAEVAALGT